MSEKLARLREKVAAYREDSTQPRYDRWRTHELAEAEVEVIHATLTVVLAEIDSLAVEFSNPDLVEANGAPV